MHHLKSGDGGTDATHVHISDLHQRTHCGIRKGRLYYEKALKEHPLQHDELISVLIACFEPIMETNYRLFGHIRCAHFNKDIHGHE